MARISLRAYNHEIEGLIESGQIDEAIAHCRQILKYYPKHVDTYRLMGKAYLESQRYSDAADILQRVLSSVPEDFVSHVGMSIIREDEGHLDESIWHMERAFEMQPANSAIQDELRRLFGRRDGYQPPKIRLTRGALARMYMKGDLYQQAIAELRAALAEDPQRLDLQELLGRLYFLAGQKVEAAEACSNVLRKLPYSLHANRIMAEVLASTDRTEEVKGYRQRLAALDPYSAHLTPATPTPQQVPDMAVSLERLDWKPGQSDTGQPDWATSIGVKLGETGSEQEALPDWLSAPEGASTTGQVESEQAQAAFEETSPESLTPEEPIQASPEDQIPDWIKNAGWSPASSSTEGPAAVFDFTEQEEAQPREGGASQELAAADIPDWLQAMAPQDEANQGLEAPPDELPSWLREDQSTEPIGEIHDESEPEKEEANEIPDWLAGASPVAGAGAATAEEIPDWLRDLADEAPANPVVEASIPESQPVEDENPDWLSLNKADEVAAGLQAEPAEELPDWLRNLEEGTPAQAETEATPTEELPDWLHSQEEQAPGVTAETTSGEEISLSTEITAEEGTEGGQGAAIFAVPEEDQGGQEGSKPEPVAETESPAFDIEDSDAAFAWLESLAVKQGAEEALLLSPEERQETPPDWVQESIAAQVEAEIGDQTTQSGPSDEEGQEPGEGEVEMPVETTPVFEQPEGSLESAREEIAESLEPGETEPASEMTPEVEIPEWLAESESGEAEPQEAEVPEAMERLQAADEIPDWLSELQEPGQAEAEATPAEEIPDWLRSFQEETIQASSESLEGEQVEAVPAEEVPTWLTGMNEQASSEPRMSERSMMEEEPPIEGDTKPTRVARLMQFPVETQEQAPVETPSEQEPVPETPVSEELPAMEAAQVEEIPDWLLKTEEEEAPAIEEPVAEHEKLLAEESSETEAIEEAPAWEFESEEGEGVGTAMVFEVPAGTGEGGGEPGQAGEAPVEEVEAESLPEFSMDDADAAFAWLESLAVKQGADEALLLSPDERQETPPEWVQEALSEEAGQAVQKAGLELEAAAEETEISPEPEAELAEEVPEWLEDLADEAAAEPASMEIEETPALPVSEEEEAEIPDWLQPVAAVSEETPTAEIEEEVESSVPELPDWLKGQEGEKVQEEEWSPTYAIPAGQEEALDLNTASLAQLEKLPGIGFIRAQNIVTYREQNGPFTSLEDLAQVPGFGPEVQAELRDWLRVDVPAKIETALEPDNQVQVELATARNAFVQGNLVTAIEEYSQLVKNRRLLPDVIRDLHEALYQYPSDVSVWQVLGDAYMRTGQLQDALNAYTKAEELLS